ncbi:PREDICTED: ras-interacting protein 1-like [Ficedula albicollis]|uniref:ras-interacting protein 1-like n=1 Tax=Ficedula albicollis TaxID=59894 RepID=UPI0007AD9081|nr:PREDICTED: ras-interacting protein 1-like [Ficedula albicollis]
MGDNLLCTPRGCLEQATWARLRAEFPALSPAQLHHVLRHYRLGRDRAAPPAWSPSPEESGEANTGETHLGTPGIARTHLGRTWGTCVICVSHLGHACLTCPPR